MVLSVTGLSVRNVIGHVSYDTYTHMYIPSIVIKLALPVITVTINMLSITHYMYMYSLLMVAD